MSYVGMTAPKIRDALSEVARETADVMRQVAAIADVEHRHAKADEWLVGILRGLGFDEAMDVYEAMDKWYA